MQISGETVVATSGKEDWDFVALPILGGRATDVAVTHNAALW
jgi:hypothetical protein